MAVSAQPPVATSISLQAGASRLDVDLTDLQVTRFSFEGGASNLNLTLPARVESTLVEIHAGAAGIDLRLPDGVAMRLRARSVGSLDVDEKRFPRRDAGLYESPDYGSAKFRADVSLDGGSTSIHVH